jgi:hypothetical protein
MKMIILISNAREIQVDKVLNAATDDLKLKLSNIYRAQTVGEPINYSKY